jgi:conjugative relaxase-like TrwC/TraI family protein
MLSPKTKYSLTNAKEYFEEHLCAGDYYSEGEKIAGEWFGSGAELLSLSGRVGRDEFINLCDNLHPRTGKLLTQRLKTTRLAMDGQGEAHEVANRRVFYDFTFSPPKSVSVAALVGGDARIVDADRRAVAAALQELERFAGTRVHTGKGITDRNTGNVVCAIFQHDTSRALDPHIHSHCVVFNATHDSTEGRWKALENFEMLRARKYVENVYYHELARRLGHIGYEIENSPRGDFEIKGITKELRERFSKRHREIDDRTRELLAQNSDLAGENINDVREHVAHDRRQRKIKGVGTSALRSLWAGQISETEGKAISALPNAGPVRPNREEEMVAQAAVVWAEEHLFDRRSVVFEHELWRHALEHARGQNISIEELQSITRKRDYIRNKNSLHQVTTFQTLQREWDIVCLAKDLIGQFAPLCGVSTITNPRLDGDQGQAVERILRSRDFVTLFRGGAGTGKSFALREVRVALETVGRTIQVIAPQRQQVIDLQQDGFAGAQTVSEFLTKQSMVPGTVVIVDEAGQLGAKQMQQFLRYVSDNAGRVILSGDTRQHGAVEASDALRAIEKYSGLRPAELSEIRRQDPARAKTSAERRHIEQYRQAVKEAAEGKLSESFRRLDQQGAIVVCSLLDQQERLAEHYLALAQERQSAVVISQTWSEIHKVNDRVRSALKSQGLIGANEQVVTALEPVDLTSAQKRDRRFYSEDTIVVLNRDAGGFKKGQAGRLVAITQNGLVVEAANTVRTVSFKFVDRLTVCQPREMTLADGDRLQLKSNSSTTNGRRIANGELVTVEKALLDGRIRLRDGRILAKDYRQFVRGFAITSYASQGKTVDYVLFSDSAIKPATNQQQWYVTISRGRRGIKIFTSDKEQLRENILHSGDRELAMDLANKKFVQRLGIPWSLVRNCPRARVLAEAMSRRIRDLIATRRERGIHQSPTIEATP